MVANHLPVRVSKSKVDGSWQFERDEDALIAHVQVRVAARQVQTPHVRSAFATKISILAIPLSVFMQDGVEDMEVLYVGCLSVEIEGKDQEVNILAEQRS